jgi:hypothetical protein
MPGSTSLMTGTRVRLSTLEDPAEAAPEPAAPIELEARTEKTATAQDAGYWQVVRAFIKDHGRAPTGEEIALKADMADRDASAEPAEKPNKSIVASRASLVKRLNQ